MPGISSSGSSVPAWVCVDAVVVDVRPRGSIPPRSWRARDDERVDAGTQGGSVVGCRDGRQAGVTHAVRENRREGRRKGKKDSS